MKDEEMAEEIVKRNVCENCNRCQSHGYIGCDIYKYSKDSFLAGLKVGRPQWHYLTENPNDLPKKEGPYRVCVRDGRYKEDRSWEWTSKPVCKTATWLDGTFIIAGGLPVIAWCEIPTFDKE